MAKKKESDGHGAPFQGRWRITEMELWDKEALDLIAPAFIEIDGDKGEIRFIAVRAWLDIRYTTRDGKMRMEFSWEGMDERDPRSGRGWLETGNARRISGHFFFHMGDASSLTCEPW